QLSHALQRPLRACAWGRWKLAFATSSNIARREDLYHLNRMRLGQRTTIEDFAVLNHPIFSDTPCGLTIGDDSYVGRFVQLSPQAGSIKIGSNCTIHQFCVLLGEGGITIGDDVRIAASTVIASANHVFA